MTTWQAVAGFEGAYEVSRCGRVRSLDRYLPNRNGLALRRGRELKPVVDAGGYCSTQLNHRGVCLTVFVHKLVAEAFIGPRPDGCEINHKSGVKTDNAVDNLEYLTPAANIHHAARVLGRTLGWQACNIKLTAADIPRIRELVRSGTPPATVGDLFAVSDQAVRSIMHGRTWRHIPDVASSEKQPCPRGGAASRARRLKLIPSEAASNDPTNNGRPQP